MTPLGNSEIELAMAELRASSEHLLRAASLMRAAAWNAHGGGRPLLLERRLLRHASTTIHVVQQLERQRAPLDTARSSSRR